MSKDKLHIFVVCRQKLIATFHGDGIKNSFLVVCRNKRLLVSQMIELVSIG